LVLGRRWRGTAMLSHQGMRPRFSVITPCLNGARYVGEAIDSVLMQGYSDTEHIVADGGSTDDTLEILGRYSHLKVLSSPDRGMYDALNRALLVAQGELIGILNSDDCYADRVFPFVIEAFRDVSVLALAGRAVTFRDAANGDQIVVNRITPVGNDVLFASTLGNPSINAWFFRPSVFAMIGLFDASYRVAGDREFMLRFALSGLRYAEAKELVCRYRIHPGSMTFGGSEESRESILREHNRMTDLYLAKPGLSKRARQLIRRTCTRDTLSGALHSARRHDVRKLIRHAVAGTRHDPVWPARFAKRAMNALATKIGFSEWGGRT
jgi:glycosyltransferase involved in cell wall biosynthesis